MMKNILTEQQSDKSPTWQKAFFLLLTSYFLLLIPYFLFLISYFLLLISYFLHSKHVPKIHKTAHGVISSYLYQSMVLNPVYRKDQKLHISNCTCIYDWRSESEVLIKLRGRERESHPTCSSRKKKMEQEMHSTTHAWEEETVFL